MALVTVIPGIFTTPGLPTLGVRGFVDTFTRPDATSLGSTEGMPKRPWQVWVTSGTPVQGVADNAGYIYRVEGASHTLATADAMASDGVLEVTQGAMGTGAQYGPVVRATDANNYIRVVNAQGAEYRLQKFVAGSLTLLGAATGVTPKPGDVVRIELAGTSITVFINGIQRITATDAHNVAATRHGFYNNTQGSTIRDVKFTAA